MQHLDPLEVLLAKRIMPKQVQNPLQSTPAEFAATTSVAAEAEQGEGPAAASSSASAVGKNSPSTKVATVVVGKDYAAAASEAGVAVVGPNAASAASKIGVVAVGPDGAAATSNAANGSQVTTHREHPQADSTKSV